MSIVPVPCRRLGRARARSAAACVAAAWMELFAASVPRRCLPRSGAGALAACIAACMAMLAMPAPSRADTVASLLGNFTINQFCALTVAGKTVAVRYAVVYGQLPALRELHNADADGNGVTTQAERDAYVEKLAPGFADGLGLLVDGVRVPLHAVHWTSSLPTEQGGFSLRVDVDFTGTLTDSSAATATLRLVNANFTGRLGWHEIMVQPAAGVALFDTNAFSTSATGGLTEALQALPEAGPLDERSVHMSVASAGAVPAGAVMLGPRPQAGLPTIKPTASASKFGRADNSWIAVKTKQLIDAISAPRLEAGVAAWALLAALLLGAVHALSPGHGKTIVGAYLIGSRGTPRHAAFLGFTVTLTHTLGVFLLGFATLYASRYIVPERLFPILSLLSALLVAGMGIVLLVQRGRAARRVLLENAPRGPVFLPVQAAAGGLGSGHALMFAHGGNATMHSHGNAAMHSHGDATMHSHGDATMHSHGGGAMHSHLPPGAAGEQVTWKSLAALGISGGLVPCPSAMVLLLAAVALNKTAFGMLLVLVFSVGLAITLTVVGLAFLYARNRFRRPDSKARWPHLLPVLSAGAITVIGVFLCVGALRSFG